MYDCSYGQPWLMGICMYGHQCLLVWLLSWTALMVIFVLMVALTGYLYMYYCICCFLSKNYHQWGYVHTFLILCNGIEGMALQIFHPCLTGVLTSFFSYLTVNLIAHSRNGTEGIGIKFQWQWRDGLNFDGIEGINSDLKILLCCWPGHLPTEDLQLRRLVDASPLACLWIDLPMQSKPFQNNIERGSCSSVAIEQELDSETDSFTVASACTCRVGWPDRRDTKPPDPSFSAEEGRPDRLISLCSAPRLFSLSRLGFASFLISCFRNSSVIEKLWPMYVVNFLKKNFLIFEVLNIN